MGTDVFDVTNVYTHTRIYIYIYIEREGAVAMRALPLLEEEDKVE